MITRICLVIAAASGCVSPMSQLRSENRQLSAELVELRADHRAQDRKIRDLQDQLAMAKENTVVPEMPQLPVEVVAPPAGASKDAEKIVGVAADGEEIVYEGDAATGKPPPPAAAAPAPMEPVPSTSDRLEVTHRIPPVSARSAPHARTRDVAVTSEGAADEYRAAVELVRAGKHAEAQSALRAFLKAYPRHDYADNAQYWLGECFYDQKRYDKAAPEFRTVLTRWPTGNKAPDAMLKLGFSLIALGDVDKGGKVLREVPATYPRTEAARLASERLAQLSPTEGSK